MKKNYQLFRFFIAGMLLLASFSLQAQTVSRSGSGFVLNGGAYKFIGTNMWNLPYESNSNITQFLTDAHSAGNRVIRVYISNRNHDKFAAASKLTNLLNLAQQVSSDLRFIVVFTDFYQATNSHAPGDEAYYVGGLLKNASWYDWAYQLNYLPYVQHIVNSHSNDSRIFAWELGNELASENTNKAYMLNFAYNVGSWIQANSSQMVTTGFINTSHATWSGSFSSDTMYKMYVSYNGQTSPFDFAVMHFYDHDFTNAAHNDELNYLRYTLGKPFIIEEVGFNGGLNDQNTSTCGGMNIFRGAYWSYGGVNIADAKPNRGPAITTVVDKFFSFGADGAMSWSYLPYSYAVSFGDDCRGVDLKNHNSTDFYAIKNYFSGKAATLPTGGTGGGTLTNVARTASLYSQTSQYSSDFSGWKAFDGLTSTKWTSNGASATGYIILNLGRSYNVKEFKVKHASTGGEWTSMNTERFSLRYWNGSAWVDAVYNYYNGSQLGTTTHPVNINAQYVMLYILDPNFVGDNYARIPEFEVYAPSGSREAFTTTSEPTVFTSTEVMAAFPNPVDNGKVTFAVQASSDEAAVLNITDLQGRVVKTYQASLTEGRNTFTIDVTDLQKGMYIYNLEGHDMSQAQKLIIK